MVRFHPGPQSPIRQGVRFAFERPGVRDSPDLSNYCLQTKEERRERMKVLFLTRLFYPHIGGVEKHVYEISKRLIKLGYEVTVVTETITHQLKTQNSNLDKIGILRIPVGKDDWFKKFRIWREVWKTRKLIQDADVIHCHDVFFWYLPFRFIYPSKPVYTTFHGYEGNKIPSKKAILMHKIAEKLSKGNICIGDFLKKWYGTRPTYVTYGAVKIQNPKFKINSKLKILFLGRIEEETGIMEYLKALKILKDKRQSFELTVLGDGSLRDKSEKFSKKNNLKVVFKGFIKDVNKFILQSNYVFASRYLGILEGLAAKKFVFAQYNNAIKKDYLKMAPFVKFISIAKNYQELSSQIEFFLKNESERNQKIMGGFYWVSGQTWDKVVEIYLRLWDFR